MKKIRVPLVATGLAMAILAAIVYTSTRTKIADVQLPEVNDISDTEIPIQPARPQIVTILLAGDVMLGRSVMGAALDAGDNKYPFVNVADKMRAADLVFLNLENPIIENCPRHSGGFTFCAPPALIEGLNHAGVDVVTLANNHSSNYGREGLQESVIHLQKNGIEAVGVGNFVIKEEAGISFGFLGFDFLSNSPTNDDFELVRRSDPEVDVLIVGVHWGVEYVAVANENQRENARKLVEAGADVVAGHHPHWVQDKEYIDGKPVYYSLGNFVFDQMWSEETKKGIAMLLTFDDGKLISEETLPVYTPLIGQPIFVDPD